MGSSSEHISFSSTTKPNGCLLQCEFKLPPRLFCKTVRCCSAFSTRPLRFKWADSEAQSAALSASPSNVHLPQFHRLSTRVNIYKCALNNICMVEWGRRAHGNVHSLRFHPLKLQMQETIGPRCLS